MTAEDAESAEPIVLRYAPHSLCPGLRPASAAEPRGNGSGAPLAPERVR